MTLLKRIAISNGNPHHKNRATKLLAQYDQKQIDAWNSLLSVEIAQRQNRASAQYTNPINIQK